MALPRGARAFHRYRSGRDLGTLIASMLEYSNNFVANGLFLALGDRGDGRPLTLEAAQEAFAAWADRRFGWRGYRVEEGAGLSRGNRLSARQLVDVLRLFAPYRELLPAQDERIRAKTGTLRNVTALAGDDAGLRASQQLIAGEADQVRAFSERFLHGGFVRQSVFGCIKKSPGAKIHHERHIVKVCQFGKVARLHAAGNTPRRPKVEHHGHFG